MYTIWLTTLTFISLSSVTHADGNSNNCSPPKKVSLKIGHEGIVKCVCDDSISLYWYFGNETTSVSPFIYIDNSVKYGPGYLSGEYDINVNGSLVIKNVSATHGGAYAVVIIEPGNPEPRVEVFTVVVEGTEETDVTMTSNYDEKRKATNAEIVTKITTDEPGKILTSTVKESCEHFVEIADIKDFQAEMEQLKRFDLAILALLVIVLFGIVVVVWRSFTANSKKNPKYDEEKAQYNQQLIQPLVCCH